VAAYFIIALLEIVATAKSARERILKIDQYRNPFGKVRGKIYFSRTLCSFITGDLGLHYCSNCLHVQRTFSCCWD